MQHSGIDEGIALKRSVSGQQLRWIMARCLGRHGTPSIYFYSLIRQSKVGVSSLKRNTRVNESKLRVDETR